MTKPPLWVAFCYLSAMTEKNTFIVLNASAGSGKTYSLVKQYITTLLKSKDPNKFRHLLAITFTNKAVAEMKNRVLETLKAIGDYKQGDKPDMLDDLASASNLPVDEVVHKSKEILNRILHNYAAFDIVTIDTLTHRIIRTFAKDLNISSSFEVSLDQKTLSAQAVDALVAKVGVDNTITKVLVDFALEKADDDKSWDISRDLLEIASLLHNENDLKALELLKSKSLSDFDELARFLNTQIKSLASKQQETGKSLLDFIHTLGLDQKSFASGYYYKFIVQVASGIKGLKYSGSGYKDNIEEYAFYTKGQKDDIKSIIDANRNRFVDDFLKLKSLASQQKKYEAFRSKLIPLSVLHLIKKELDLIKEEENVLLISDFNALISKSLKDQPAAFLYERLGERYTNYFIDEFQDTSVMQWDNLVPLIDNTISSASGDEVSNSLLLVGDPKQAIYRWRGGEAEQFIALSHQINPFTTEATVARLDTNYRSNESIIHFNNSFFTHLAVHFNNELYSEIYKTDNAQGTTSKKDGYVSLEFIDYENNEEADLLYPERVIEIINEVTAQGYLHSDICILTRSNKHGTHIAQVLQEAGTEVVSSESLLIENSPTVQFIHNFITMLSFPKQLEYRLAVLYFLGTHYTIKDTHNFYSTHTASTLSEFLEQLKAFDVFIHLDYLKNLSLYEYIEYIIRSFYLAPISDAYVVAYLDLAYNYAQAHSGGVLGFIDYWEEKREKASIVAPAQDNAVQIMSIHKSKGLEFPVVIYPYADSDLYRTRGEHQWFPMENEDINGFNTLMVPHNSALNDFGDAGIALFEKRNNEQQFDTINVLYVALTRASERLYVLSRFRESVKKIGSYSDLFIDYLQNNNLWNNDQREYSFGSKTAAIKKNKTSDYQNFTPTIRSTAKEELGIQVITQASFLWDEKKQNAITYGNLIHELMAAVTHHNTITAVVDNAVRHGIIPQESRKVMTGIMNQVVSHPDLKLFFEEENTVYNERMILASDGRFHIPDRVVVTPDGSTIIIDYKTGVHNDSYAKQLATYAGLYQEMGYNVTHKLLVYIDSTIEVVAV